ncbi:bifunctional proline dehydrogenase/L-glutamate gamma-semialdehyde dehydrogenase PutA [Pontivivens insulae]|uniref:Bifunctional protein PutA n=1 Tax=Pontivivens insulae TaxID=1639689 RepID=A0A2R8A9G3_9RHOB|nr:bifunctional proline dehydrogenase/L-glutamate gamma-semialdehyde dehydrogenase PutA [Pontivivens insulae]RED12755.1 L-proline dehydrogenase /delta-1-pyrroline-5-carboxylate dehydrogenase [Pontivivens insulae]SPF28846.1 Bifunctional protein PutA [Pontivivens insulae]
MDLLGEKRQIVRAGLRADEQALVEALAAQSGLSTADQQRIAASGADLVRRVRAQGSPSLMDVFLAEYGLTNDEGIALMCLAEALLRVPDAATIDALIDDKIGGSDWASHAGHSTSPLVNASTWALMLTGRVLAEDAAPLTGTLRRVVRRLGEPVIRAAVARAMREMGRQFVLGESIEAGLVRARKREDEGYTYSYDMLGEAAMTAADAGRYRASYTNAMRAIGAVAHAGTVAVNPGISIKLSALHPRYEFAQRDRVMAELVPIVRDLARQAAALNIGLNIDAEEAARLDLSLDVIEAVARDPELGKWDGLGVVVQAYGLRAGPVIDWIAALARQSGRRMMVRLVKGAYWDTEIKHAQEQGLTGYPVFTRKSATDISYLACARKLLDLREVLYPQFATHNAHTVAAVFDMAGDTDGYEFQRLHGMGQGLHEAMRAQVGTRCRIYAPVGAHKDLLAYLVRRLLENGANSSFVNRMADESLRPEQVAGDPFAELKLEEVRIGAPNTVFAPRRDAMGFDLDDPVTVSQIEAERARWRTAQWRAEPIIAGTARSSSQEQVSSPNDPGDVVGTVSAASDLDIEAALSDAGIWTETVGTRAAVLRRAADLYEEAWPELFALATREAGKTLPDCVAELREAVDFLRYYADEAERRDGVARGTFVCISPWNFPLAIFTGQVAAALAMGNAVIAKPADQTPLMAAAAVRLLHRAGVPRAVLQLLPGSGAHVGAALVADARVAGVCFTGSTATAIRIDRAMAESGNAAAPLIAETGGLNAMIVDSTALPEQAVRDVVASAFQSAGQRCSAARVLYVQEDTADTVLTMLKGAMDELNVADTWALSSDLGSVIDGAARDRIEAHIAGHEVLHRVAERGGALSVAPTLLRIDGIGVLDEEVFGPVLHVATFRAEELDQVIDAINASGYGLTFGLHTRIDDRVQHIIDRVACGNIYVNRNQIGAVVGSQPFGGEGLSGTGPKAGGPDYLDAFGQTSGWAEAPLSEPGHRDEVEPALTLKADLPGPTGESNRLMTTARGRVLCVGPGDEMIARQSAAARAMGCEAVALAASETLEQALATMQPLAAVCADPSIATVVRKGLANRAGARIPILFGPGEAWRLRQERHVCVDLTASGGNAGLLAATGLAVGATA